MLRLVIAGSMVLGGVAAVATADQNLTRDPIPGSSHVQYVEVATPDTGHAYVVRRAVVAPAATVSRALSEQPVRPHMVEVRVVASTTYIDPAVDHYRQNENPIDEGHSLLKAQRLAQSLRNPGVIVVYGSPRPQPEVSEVKPQWILIKPDGKIKTQPGGPMPMTPEPRKAPQPMACSQ